MNYDKMVLKPLIPETEDFLEGIKIYEERFDGSMRLNSETITVLMQKTVDDTQLYSYGFYHQ